MSPAHARRDPLLLAVTLCAVAYGIAIWWFCRNNLGLAPDAIDYAEAARSLARGQGDTINRVFFHTGLFSSLRHPLEVHGLLQPLLIAPLFRLFAPMDSLVRVPGALFSTGLVLVTFLATRRLFGAAAGIIAAAVVLSRSDVLLMVCAASDDVGEAFFCYAALIGVVLGIDAKGDRRWFAAAGCFAALAVLEKGTGVLVVATLVALMAVDGRARKGITMGNLALAMVPALAAAALYAHRNVRVYGTLGSPYGAVEWLGKADFHAYFALYEAPRKTGEVLAALGRAKVLSLVREQFKELGAVLVKDAVLSLGVPLAVAFGRKRAALSSCVVLLTLGLVFLVCVVHHVESRYLSPLVPFAAMGIGAAAQWAKGRCAGALRDRPIARYRAVAVAALPVLLVAAATRSVVVARYIGKGPWGVPCADAARYVRDYVDPEGVFLTANPWFVTWGMDRAAVMAPTNGVAANVRVIRHYGVKWVLTGAAVIGAAPLEPMLASPEFVELGPTRAFAGKGCDVYSLEY